MTIAFTSINARLKLVQFVSIKEIVMNNDLELYNTDTLHELYAVACWKVYGKFPEPNFNYSRIALINKINSLSYKLASKGD